MMYCVECGKRFDMETYREHVHRVEWEGNPRIALRNGIIIGLVLWAVIIGAVVGVLKLIGWLG